MVFNFLKRLIFKSVQAARVIYGSLTLFLKRIYFFIRLIVWKSVYLGILLLKHFSHLISNALIFFTSVFYFIASTRAVLSTVFDYIRTLHVLGMLRGWRFQFRRFRHNVKHKTPNFFLRKKKLRNWLFKIRGFDIKGYFGVLLERRNFSFLKFGTTSKFSKRYTYSKFIHLARLLNLFGVVLTYARSYLPSQKRTYPLTSSANLSFDLINRSQLLYLHLNSFNVSKSVDGQLHYNNLNADFNPLYGAHYFPYTSHAEDERRQIFKNVHLKFKDDVLPYGPDFFDFDFYYELNGGFQFPYAEAGWDLGLASRFTLFSYWLRWYGWLGVNYSGTNSIILFSIIDLHAKCREAQQLLIQLGEPFFIYEDTPYNAKQYLREHVYNAKSDIQDKTTALGKKGNFSPLYGHRDFAINTYWSRYSPNHTRLFYYVMQDWIVWTLVFGLFSVLFLAICGHFFILYYFSHYDFISVYGMYPYKTSYRKANTFNQYEVYISYWPFMYKSQPSIFFAPFEWFLFERSLYGRFGLLNQLYVEFFVPEFFAKRIWRYRTPLPTFTSDIYAVFNYPSSFSTALNLRYNSYNFIDPYDVVEDTLNTSRGSYLVTFISGYLICLLSLLNYDFMFYVLLPLFLFSVVYVLFISSIFVNLRGRHSVGDGSFYLFLNSISSIPYFSTYFVRASSTSGIDPYSFVIYKFIKSRFNKFIKWFDYKNLYRGEAVYYDDWIYPVIHDWSSFKLNTLDVSFQFPFLSEFDRLRSLEFMNWSGWHDSDFTRCWIENEIFFTDEADEEFDEMEESGTDLYWRFEYYSTDTSYDVKPLLYSSYNRRLEFLYYNRIAYPSFCRSDDFFPPLAKISPKFSVQVLENGKSVVTSDAHLKGVMFNNYCSSIAHRQYKKFKRSLLIRNIKTPLYDNYKLVQARNAVQPYFFFPFDRWIEMEDFLFSHTDDYFMRRVCFSTALLKLRYYSLWHFFNYRGFLNKMNRIFTLKSAAVTTPFSVTDDYMVTIHETYDHCYADVAEFFERVSKEYINNTITYIYMADVPIERDYELNLVSWYENLVSIKAGIETDLTLGRNYSYYFRTDVVSVLDPITDEYNTGTLKSLRLYINDLYWAQNEFKTWLPIAQEDSVSMNYLTFSESVPLLIYLINQFEQTGKFSEFANDGDDIIVPSVFDYKDICRVFPSSSNLLCSKEQLSYIGAWPYTLDLESQEDKFFVDAFTIRDGASIAYKELDEQNYPVDLVAGVPGLTYEQRVHLLIDYRKRTFMRYYDIIDTNVIQNMDIEVNDVYLTSFWLSEHLVWFTTPSSGTSYDSWL